MSKHISLYRKIDENLIDQMGFNVEAPLLSYDDGSEEKIINIPELEENTIYINAYDSQWDPNLNNLRVEIKFSINNASLLYGASSVAHPDNQIKVGARIYSRSSNFNFISDSYLIKNTSNKQNNTFNINFPKNYIRGQFKIELFMYLASLKTKVLGQANQIGMLLNQFPVYLLTIFADGDGSLFPITEFQDPTGPLWRLEKSWTDASEEVFDASSVRLALNTAYPLFKTIKEGRLKISEKFMLDIVTQCISMIIQEVIFFDKEDIDLAEESVENSILRMVKYWVDTYEIDTSSIISITNSLNLKTQEQIGGDNS